MKKLYCWMLLAVAFVCASCIRDELAPCPPLQVNLTVKDKNYFNVDRIKCENRLDENLAFQAYVPTLYYQLRDVATGETVEEQGVFRVEGDEKTFPVTFCECLPFGTYELTVWGGLNDLTALNADRSALVLHPGQREGLDIYVAHTTLVYDPQHYDYTASLERTKGKLIVQVENLPQEVTRSTQQVTRLMGEVKSSLDYAGETEVNTVHAWDHPEQVMVKTHLAPSVQKLSSKLDVCFIGDDGLVIDLLKPMPVHITMYRNELTWLRYVYQETGFIIYVWVNDNWEILHGLDLD